MASNRNEQTTLSGGKNCYLLPLVLLILVGGGFSLELIGFLKLDPFNQRNDTSHLCRLLPSSDSCTFKPENEDVFKNSTSKGEKAFSFFTYTQAMCVFFQCISINFIISHIYYFFIIFYHWCLLYNCCLVMLMLECCFCEYIHWLWIILEGFAGVVCIGGCLFLGIDLSPSDIQNIDGFSYCLSNGILCILKFVGFIVYHKKVGFPSGDYFYGNRHQFSHIKWKKEGVLHTTTYKTNDRGVISVIKEHDPIYRLSYN